MRKPLPDMGDVLKSFGLSAEQVAKALASAAPPPKPKKRQAPPRYSNSERLAREMAEAEAHYQEVLKRDAGKTVTQ